MAEKWVARSQGVDYRRSPYKTAKDIDLFDVAVDEDINLIFWQFLHFDVNPNIADERSYYWEMCDEQEHAAMTKFYSWYKTQDPTTADPNYETNARQPGRSPKWSDKHTIDFKDFFSVNVKGTSAPYRAIRTVMIKEIDDFKDMIGAGILAIDDNNQYPIFQFQDNNGWKNFCPVHVGELKQSILKDSTFVKLPAYYTDSRSWRVSKTNIAIDFLETTRQGKKNKRSIRFVWVTPIKQIGVFTDWKLESEPWEPEWSAAGPRLPNMGPPPEARSQKEEDAAAAASDASAASAGGPTPEEVHAEAGASAVKKDGDNKAFG